MAKTNIQYLKENNLMEAHKHFMHLSEGYATYLPEDTVLNEEGEDDPTQGGGDPNAMGGDPMAQGGADPMAGGDDPNAIGGDPNAAAGGDPMAQGGADPMASGDPNAMGADPMGGDPMAGGADPMEGMGMDEPADDGTTIDIDGLTKAQEKLNSKENQVGLDLSKVDDRIIKLIDVVKNLQDALDSNNAQIEDLKAEFEKRNPTQTEKLNLRSLDSYPYSVKPNDYWDKKTAEGGYQAYSDNDEPTTQEYTITNDDVDHPNKDIADTFFKIDDDDIQTLDKLFKF